MRSNTTKRLVRRRRFCTLQSSLTNAVYAMQSFKSIELLCLAHRYLYYVKCSPILSDYRYDLLESEALKAISQDSLLNKPGSDNPKDYPQEAIELAEKLAA